MLYSAPHHDVPIGFRSRFSTRTKLKDVSTRAHTLSRSHSRFSGLFTRHGTSPGNKLPQGPTLAHRRPATALALASCALLGLWAAAGFAHLTSSTVYLDRNPESPSSEPSRASPNCTTPIRRDTEAIHDPVLRVNDVTRQLCRDENTFIPPPGSGIARYDSARLASNEPTEDQLAEAVLPTPSGYWTFFGLLDGHDGRDTSAWLANNLIPAVTGALADLYSRLATTLEVKASENWDADIGRTLKDTFNRLDDDLVNAPLSTVFSTDSRYIATTLLVPAYSGSCALLSFYDSHTGKLQTALTGDSRAVLGRPEYDESGKPTGTYTVHVLTDDQNGWNASERERLEAEHPGEQIVHNGRVMGMGISRAFGDARYKWPLDVQDRLKRAYLGRSLLPHVKTPPYITAEPVVTSTTVRPGDSLILATDGLWEALTNEEAVGLVGLWKELRSTRSTGGLSASGREGVSSAELPVRTQAEGYDGTVRYRQWGAQKRFVSGDDENAATHLLRNALGGADADLAAALLSMRPPRSRVYRDDITIVVVFFGEEDRRTST